MPASPMRPAIDLLAQYAAYHRDRRNIVTHFVGVPMIVFAVGVLLARPSVMLGGFALTPAWIVFALVALWYLTRGEFALGAAVSAVVGALIYLAHAVAGGSIASWLAWGLGFFIVGWIIQFVGHYYEGKKPAFADDLVGLIVGPMFVTAEALFAAGWGKALLGEIERRVGPTYLRDLAQPVAR
jgi:uncharacterized membrane protein YGL010W